VGGQQLGQRPGSEMVASIGPLTQAIYVAALGQQAG